MAQVSTDAGWMTSFIYEQDLTSLYMNNIFTGALRPGVYNANLGVVQTNQGAVYLFVKKGTTFLFSNTYENESENCRRSFGGVDGKDGVIIKCVALEDKNYLLATETDLAALTADISKELFVFAYIEYYNDALHKNAPSVPTFVLTKRQNRSKDNTDVTNHDHYLYPTLNNIYSAATDTAIASPSPGTESYKYMVPDGSRNYQIAGSSRKLSSYSFLMLGALVRKYVDDATLDSFKLSPRDWLSVYTFTGHGMPEYRHSMLSDQSSDCPDIIFKANDSLEGMYIDLPYSYVDSVLFNSRPVKTVSSDNEVWEAFYHNTPEIDSTAPKVSFNLSPKENTQVTESTTPMVVIDMVYGLFTSDTVGLPESSSVFEDASCSLQLGSYREITAIEKKPNLTWSTTELTGVVHSLPLDICEDNIRRLLPLIEGKNLWNRLVDRLRVNDALDNNTSLIPIAVGFRFWEEQEDGTFAWRKGATSDKVVDPAYVIPYIGRAAEVNGVNRITDAFTNINNLIPII